MSIRKPYTVPKTMRQSLSHPDPMIRIAKRMVPLGGWDGHAKTVTIPFAPDTDEVGFVVLVQNDTGRMIGAVDWTTIATTRP